MIGEVDSESYCPFVSSYILTVFTAVIGEEESESYIFLPVLAFSQYLET